MLRLRHIRRAAALSAATAMALVCAAAANPVATGIDTGEDSISTNSSSDTTTNSAGASLFPCAPDTPPAGTSAADAAAPQHTLPLPSVPDSLKSPASRAAYIVAHFWDALDFNDACRARNPRLIEQSLADFVSLFPIAPAETVPPAVRSLVRRAADDPQALELLCETAESYLYDTDSPLCNEEFYLPFADAFAESPLPEYTLLRIEAQRQTIRKNRRGTVAADFAFESPDGMRRRLSDSDGGAQWRILLFYDPDCDHCMETVACLAAAQWLADAIAAGRVAVYAVYAGMGEHDRERWRQTLSRIPDSWTAGFDNGSIYTLDIYVLRRMPAIYLLDPARRVILKDPSSDSLEPVIAGASRSTPISAYGTPAGTPTETVSPAN